ncbi:MAG TPA: hypothetical protein VFJ79_08450 [Acidimicrobiales bacterium]|nr:hypothetical protein [Acidimicrobiales bacterium]
MITVQGGPTATANIPGPHNDAADFWGSGLVILVIIGAIALTRLVFRRPASTAEETSAETSDPSEDPRGEARHP